MTPTFVLLGSAIVAVWLPPLRLGEKSIPTWPPLFIAAVVAGLWSGVLTLAALIPLCVLCAAAFGGRRPGWPGCARRALAGLADPS